MITLVNRIIIQLYRLCVRGTREAMEIGHTTSWVWDWKDWEVCPRSV